MTAWILACMWHDGAVLVWMSLALDVLDLAFDSIAPGAWRMSGSIINPYYRREAHVPISHREVAVALAPSCTPPGKIV